MNMNQKILRKYVVPVVVLWAMHVQAFSQVALSEWIVRAGDKGWDVVNGIAADTAGNIIITGSIADTSSLSKNGSPALNSAGSSFLSKYDTSGKLLWNKRINGPEPGYGCLLAVDNANRILLAGKGYLPGSKPSKPSIKTSSFFLSCLDENGESRWSRSFSGTNLDFLSAISLDPFTGDILITGYFHDTLSVDSQKLVSAGKTDAFLLRFSSSGELQKAISFGGKGSDRISCALFNSKGNMVVAGTFQRKVAFTKKLVLSLQNPSETGVFVATFSPEGACLSARIIGSGRKALLSELLFQDNRYYLSGSFSDILSMDGMSLSSKGGDDIFLACLDTAMDLRWVKQVAGERKEHAGGLTISHGHIILTGSYASSLHIDNHEFPYIKKGSDVFVLAIDTTGRLNWIRTFGGKSDEFPRAILAGANGYLYVPGSYRDTLKVGANEITSAGNEDLFIARIEDCSEKAPKFKNPETFCKGDQITLDAGPGYSNYNWNNGQSLERKFVVDEPGLYSLELSAPNGCIVFDTISVNANKAPEVFIGNDTTISDTSILVLNAGGPYKSYTWSNGSKSRTMVVRGYELPEKVNRIAVQVTNAEGCTGYDEMVVSVEKSKPNAISALLDETCVLFPNPVQDKLTVYFTADFENLEVQIFNQLGTRIGSRMVSEYKAGTQMVFDLDTYAPGFYTVAFHCAGGFASKKIVLQ